MFILPQTKSLGHTDAISYASFSPNDLFVLTCGNDSQVILWNVEVNKMGGELTFGFRQKKKFTFIIIPEQ